MSYGVYGIYHGDTLLYIGSSGDLDRRFKQHIRQLKQGKHRNKTLQKHVNENEINVDELIFKLIHKTLDSSKSRLYIAEVVAILLYKPKCNRAVLQASGASGRAFLSFSKPEVEFDEGILKYL